MPITLNPVDMAVRNENGYTGVNVVAQQKTSEMIEAIQQKGSETLASIPPDYTDLKSQIVEIKRNVWNAVYDGKCKNDGTSDCSDIVQSAVESIGNGGILYFPKGAYVFKKAIVIRNKTNIKIIGDGGVSSSVNGTMFLCQYSWTCFSVYGGNDVEISDITFVGSADTATAIGFLDDSPTTLDCRVTKSIVKNCIIREFKNGVTFDAPSGYNYFENVCINHMRSGGYGMSFGLNYMNTYIDENDIDIIPNYIYIRDCKIDGLTSQGIIAGILIKTAQMVWLEGNDICNLNIGVRMQNDNSANAKLDNIFFHNNSFYNDKIGIDIISSNDYQIINGISISKNMFVSYGISNAFGARVSKKSQTNKDLQIVNIIGNTFKFTGANPTYIGGKVSIDPNTSYIVGAGLE